MRYLAIANAVVAVGMLLWLRRLSRARGVEIPCTSGVFSWVVVAVGVVALLGAVVGNVLALIDLDHRFGQEKSGLVFAVWLLAMSAGAILFVVAFTTFHTNRTAEAWIRPLSPDALHFRAAGQEARVVPLHKGSVRVVGVAEGIGGVVWVQYQIADGAGAIELVVQFTRAARTEGAPWMKETTGMVAQGAAHMLNQLFVQFLA